MEPSPSPVQTKRESPTLAGYELVDVLRQTLTYSRTRGYRGWDYCDGLSSAVLQALPVDNKWVNLAFQETIKRSPVNLRPLLLVEQRRNFKGTALFTLANLDVQHYEDETGQVVDRVDFAGEARSLADWLVRNQSTGYHGFCGGHKHRIQNLDGQGYPNDPDVVSTSYAVKALLAASRIGVEYAEIAETAADFVVEDLDYRPAGGGAKINYHLNHPDTYYTINAGALGARLFTDLAASFEESQYRERAREILDYVAELQTSRGGWYYREPSDESHLSMDNHHNAFIIESLLRYRGVFDSNRYDDTIERALSFFRRDLIDTTGAPNFDESDRFPRDIHAAANSILLFVYAGDLETASLVLEWTLRNLYAGDGRFYYRKHRYYTKTFTLMRWAQAWMSFAMAEYLVAASINRTHTDLIRKFTPSPETNGTTTDR